KKWRGYPLPFSAFGTAAGCVDSVSSSRWRARAQDAIAVWQQVRLFDPEEFDVKDKRGVRGDAGFGAAGAASSVAKLRRNAQLALATYFHSRDSLIPSFDYLSGSE